MKKTLFVLTILGAGVGLGLTACGTPGGGESTSQDDPNLYEIRDLKYDGSKISWSYVKGADKGYVIKVNDGLPIELDSGTLSYTYDSKGENFPFEIEALVGEKGSESNKKLSLTFTNTGNVENVEVIDGKLVWDPVDNIDGYVIYFNNQQLPEVYKNSEYVLKPGQFSAKIRTYKKSTLSRDNNPYYSFWSDNVSGRLLATPENLKFADGKFTWKAVANASYYTIRLGDDEHEVFGTSYSVDLITADMDVQVKANGDVEKKTYDSPWSESKTYKYIPPIDTLRVEDGTLKWDKPDGAVAYKIKVNGIEQQNPITKEEYGDFRAGQSTTVQILPLGDTDLFYSTWSNVMSVTLLRSPSLSFENNVLKWNQIPGAEGYTVRITEPVTGKANTFAVGQDEFTYAYDFEKEGTYVAEVKANALSAGTGLYDSKYSNAITVQRLSQPMMPQVTNQPLQANQVMIQTATVANAQKYFLYADDVKIKEANTPIFNIDVASLNDNKEETVIKFGIQAIGSFNNNAAYLDSTIREFNVTKLAAPTNVAINGSSITWDAVTNAEGYIVSIDGERYESLTTSYQLTDLSEGQHSIYVQSKGNGERVITSSHSNVLNVTKLAKPVISFVKRADGKFYVEWQAITGATAYNVKIGQNTDSAPTNNWIISDKLNYFPAGQGTQLNVFVVGDGTTTIDSDASNTITILRYAAPENISLVTDNLQWDAPVVGGVTANNFTVTDNGVALPQTITGNKIALTEFEPGSHTIQVRANGNIEGNNNTVDSEFSSQFTFTKLGNIENIVKSGSVISWDQVPGNLGYEVKFAGETLPRKLSTNTNYIDVKDIITHSGTIGISIKAIGDNQLIADGDTYTFNQVVLAIPQPERVDAFTTDYNYEFVATKSNYDVHVEMEQTSLATQYRLVIGGLQQTPLTNTTGVFDYTMPPGAYKYEFNVVYLGGKFCEDGVNAGIYYVDSSLSSTFEFTRG